MQEVDIMTKEELVATEITRYMDLLRVKQATDKEKELDNQLRESRAKLETFGVTVEKVNTANYDGKLKRQGRFVGRTASYKKAIVTLTENSKEIEFFSNL